jgi:hypothetical protein
MKLATTMNKLQKMIAKNDLSTLQDEDLALCSNFILAWNYYYFTTPTPPYV